MTSSIARVAETRASPPAEAASPVTEAPAVLWVAGLAFACILILSLARGVAGHEYAWLQYAALGLALPPAAIAAAHLSAPAEHSRVRHFTFTLAWLSAAAAAYFLTRSGTQPVAYVFAAVQLGLWAILAGALRRRPEPGPWLHRAATAAALYIIISAIWLASARLVYWNHLIEWLRRSPLTGLVLLASLVLLCWAFARPESRTRSLSRLAAGLLTAAAAVVIVLASLRTDGLFQYVSIHHWGVYVGPVMQVRSGGWLLWDAPSQYGFLSILAIAEVPAASAWQSVYLVNALLMAVSGLFVLWIWRRAMPGVLGAALAAIVAICAVFLMPGQSVILYGAEIYPSVGALRFIWTYGLILVLVLHGQRTRLSPGLLLTGCALWVIGSLWSAESCLYCSAIWLPAYVCIRLQSEGMASRGRRGWPLTTARALAVPLAMLGCALVVIAAVFAAKLGHLPDPHTFFDYALAFRGGFGSVESSFTGPVWVLFVVYVVAVSLCAEAARSTEARSDLPLALGTAAWVWITASYFIGRSHPNNISNLAPIWCSAIAICLLLLRKHGARIAWAGTARMCFVPLLTVMLVMSAGSIPLVRSFAADLHTAPQDIDGRVPSADPALEDIVRKAGAKPSDPMLLCDENLLPRLRIKDGSQELGEAPMWFPFTPLALSHPLALDRIAVYADRYARDHRRSGWLITPAFAVHRYPWLPAVLARNYTADRTVRNAAYEMTWYAYAPRGAAR